MLLSEYIIDASKLVIEEADNGLCYLDPLWKQKLDNSYLKMFDITDASVDEDDIGEILKLEVEKRNTVNSLKPYVLRWVYDIITASVEPAVLHEETDYIKNFIEYRKTNKDEQKTED